MIHGKGVFGWLKVTFVKRYKEEKGEENGAVFRNIYRELLGRFLSYLACRVAYMEGIKYVNVIEIGPVVVVI